MDRDDFYTVKEASELLRINEKKLYVLATAGQIPATKVTGKWLFPVSALRQFMIRDALSQCRNDTDPLLDQGFLLFSGSDDPALNRLFHHFHNQYPQQRVFYSCVGSFHGLELLARHQCHATFAHIYHHESDEFNFYYADQYLDADSYVIINMFHRDIGFVSHQPISSCDEIVTRGLTLVNRQQRSGVRNFSDQLLRSDGLEQADLNIFPQEMLTHFEVAQTVSEHENCVGIASRIAAKQFNLSFHKLKEEQFDLVTYKDLSLHPNLVRFVNQLKAFAQMYSSESQGYHFNRSGQIMIKGEK